MTKKLELYKFCEDKKIYWSCNNLIIWIDFCHLQEFTNIVGYNYLCQGGIAAQLLKDSVVFDLVPICEYLNIEPTYILKKYNNTYATYEINSQIYDLTCKCCNFSFKGMKNKKCPNCGSCNTII